jgi:hypothetical protein
MYVAERAGLKNALIGRAEPDEETTHEAEVMLLFALGAGRWLASSVQNSPAS